MEIEHLKRIIVDQIEDLAIFLRNEKIIERELNTSHLKNYLRHPNVLVISGVRRSGKSTLSALIFTGERYGYLNFDDERLSGFIPSDFNKLLQAFYELYGTGLDSFVFDEIQNIKGWEVFISRLRRTKKIVITGSNARLLSGELATSLTGRYISFTLYPFSFREFLTLSNTPAGKEKIYSTKAISEIKIRLKEYMEQGGFPEVFKFGRRMVRTIYDDIISKDILLRYQIKRKSTFKELSGYLVSSFGKEITFRKLSNIFNIKDVHTTRNYVHYLSESFLIFPLERFSYKLKQRYIAPKKVYCIDCGMINALAFQFSANEGRLMENAVFLELLRRRSYREEIDDIYYWRDHTQCEVDFVLKKGRKVVQLIQVCMDIEDISTRKREIKSLLKAGDELQCNNLLIITLDTQRTERHNSRQIEMIPLWRWLIEE